jgi:hypothetical protein
VLFICSFDFRTIFEDSSYLGLIVACNLSMQAMVSETESSLGLLLPACRSLNVQAASSSSIHISILSRLVSIMKAYLEGFKSFNRLPFP